MQYPAGKIYVNNLADANLSEREKKSKTINNVSFNFGTVSKNQVENHVDSIS